MKKFSFILIIFLAIHSYSQIQVTDSSKISLITCSPGKVVYEQFGHTAIRYQDVLTNTDLMFNYGTFSFNKPGFLARFIKGETDYELGVYNSVYFFPEYEERNSQVTEQELNLTQEEKQRLLDALLLNYQPENREYRYNFIFDNCATRPRIKIEEVLGDEKVVYSEEKTHYKTFRHWIGKYVGFHTWTKFGIDLLLGRGADKIATKMEVTFLPEDLMDEFSEAQIKSSSGSWRPLIKSETVLVHKRDEAEPKQTLLQLPAVVSLIILLIGLMITYVEFVKKRNWKWIDSLLLIITGLAGLIVFYLMFFSVHPLVQSNFNILWINPVSAVIGIMLWIKYFNKVTYYFQITNALLLLGALIVFFVGIQQINVASVPLILLLLVRSIFWIYKEKVKLVKG